MYLADEVIRVGAADDIICVSYVYTNCIMFPRFRVWSLNECVASLLDLSHYRSITAQIVEFFVHQRVCLLCFQQPRLLRYYYRYMDQSRACAHDDDMCHELLHNVSGCRAWRCRNYHTFRAMDTVSFVSCFFFPTCGHQIQLRGSTFRTFLSLFLLPEAVRP